jgi:2-methylisocitrate lyase-like PEP mutase family enzyme
MSSDVQKERAEQFRQFHHQEPLLVLPNVWQAFQLSRQLAPASLLL